MNDHISPGNEGNYSRLITGIVVIKIIFTTLFEIDVQCPEYLEFFKKILEKNKSN